MKTKITRYLMPLLTLTIIITFYSFSCNTPGPADQTIEETAQETTEEITIEEPEEECISYAEWINQLAKAGKYDEAIEMAEDADEPIIQAEAFTKIADTYAEDGKKDNASEMITRALEAAEKIRNVSDISRYEKTIILKEIANIYRKIGQTGNAEDILNKATELAMIIGEMEDEIIDTYYYKIDALTKIASDYAKYEQKEKALDITNQALEIAPEVENKDNNKASSLSKIARNYIELGQIDKSLNILTQSYELAEESEDNYSKVNILTEIACNYTKAG